MVIILASTANIMLKSMVHSSQPLFVLLTDVLVVEHGALRPTDLHGFTLLFQDLNDLLEGCGCPQKSGHAEWMSLPFYWRGLVKVT